MKLIKTTLTCCDIVVTVAKFKVSALYEMYSYYSYHLRSVPDKYRDKI